MAIKTVCVVGPGAIGGMMAALFERAGYTVSTLARPARVEAINARGITLYDSGKVVAAHPRAATKATELGPHDLVVVALKENGLEAVAPELMGLCKPETQIVFAMNGVPWWFFQSFDGPGAGRSLKTLDPDGTIARSIPLERVIWAPIYCGAYEKDGAVHHTYMRRLELGRPDSSLRGLAEIAEVFTKATYECTTTATVRDALWVKLQANLMNPVSALTMAPGGAIFNDPLVLDLLIAMARELRAIAGKLGIDSGPDPAERLRGMTGRVGDSRTSMLQDAERGRPLEVDAILGAAVEIAEIIDMPAPFTRAVYGLSRVRSNMLAAAAP